MGMMQTAFASKIRYRGMNIVVLTQTRERWSFGNGIFGPNFFIPRDRSSYVKPDEIITADLRTS